MKKPDCAIESEIHLGEMKFKCVKDDGKRVCDLVYLFLELECNPDKCCNMVGACKSDKREDKENVIFLDMAEL